MLGALDRRVARAVMVDVAEDEVVRRNTGRRTCSKCQRSYHVEFAPPQKAALCDACGGELVQRPDDAEDKVRARMAAYRRDTTPVSSYYEGRGLLRRVDGAGSQEAVFGRLCVAIDASETTVGFLGERKMKISSRRPTK